MFSGGVGLETEGRNPRGNYSGKGGQSLDHVQMGALLTSAVDLLVHVFHADTAFKNVM